MVIGADDLTFSYFCQNPIPSCAVRTDVDVALVVSVVDWLMDRCQDAMLTEEFDPGLFGPVVEMPEVRALRVSQFVEMLRGAVGARRWVPAGRVINRRGGEAPDRLGGSLSRNIAFCASQRAGGTCFSSVKFAEPGAVRYVA